MEGPLLRQLIRLVETYERRGVYFISDERLIVDAVGGPLDDRECNVAAVGLRFLSSDMNFLSWEIMLVQQRINDRSYSEMQYEVLHGYAQYLMAILPRVVGILPATEAYYERTGQEEYARTHSVLH